VHRFGLLVRHANATGPQCWIWDNVRRFAEPIPYVGRQGLFTVPVDMVEAAIETAEYVRAIPATV